MRDLSIRMAIVAVTLSCALPSAAWAGPPTDRLRSGMDRVFKILMDPDLAGDANAPQRSRAIARIAGDIFDFGEMSKRTLGQHWEQRTPAEREDFVRLFIDLIQRTYFSKVDEHGSGKTIFGTETVDGNHAVVRTTLLLARGAKMPLDYDLMNLQGAGSESDIGEREVAAAGRSGFAALATATTVACGGSVCCSRSASR